MAYADDAFNNDVTPFSAMKNRPLTRLTLLKTAGRMFCKTHELQVVQDVFPNGEILLVCGCRRKASA